MSTPDSSLRSALATRSGRHGPRSKNGCTTCRTRKLKCDETRPSCKRCEKAQISCDWNQPVVRRPPPDRRRRSTLAPEFHVIAHPVPNLDQAEVRSDADFSSAPPISSGAPSHVPTPSTGYIRGPDSLSPEYSLSPSHVLSNAVFLSPQDLESFEYVPRSLLVLRFGKPWRWSMLSYVHSRIASKESGVMRAFIAVASMELRSRELAMVQETPRSTEVVEKARRFKENASYALHLAMQDLSSILDRLAAQPNDQGNLEILFSMWFLILHFGIYDSDLVQVSYMHLNGMRSFLTEYFQSTTPGIIRELPPAAKQLLVFIWSGSSELLPNIYLDVMLALGGLGGGQLTIDLMNLPVKSPVHIDRLFEEARVCVPRLWGPEYPTVELLDDIENYRPLKLVHACQKLKLHVWRLGVAQTQGATCSAKSIDLWKDIEQMGEDFYDLRLLAKSIRSTDGRRVIWTVYHACLDYYGLKVLYSCIEACESWPEWLEETITELLSIAHKALNEDPQHVYRYAWALRVALFRVRDPIHRDWLKSQVMKASVLLSNLGIPSNPVDADVAHETLFVEHSHLRPAA